MGVVVDQPSQAVRLVRELKGASLSILVALAFVNQPVDQAWLERATGYTDKTVGQALLYLSETGFAERTVEGWQGTRAAQKLFMLLSGGAQLADQKSAGRPSVFDLRRNNSASTAAAVNLNPSQRPKSSSRSRKRGNHHDHAPPKSATHPQAELVHQALHEAGIGEPKLSALAGLTGVTPQAVRDWHTHLRRVKGESYNPGLLVRLLEAGETPPEARSRQAYADWVRVCEECGEEPCVCAKET
jgi:hypothetical protein